MAAEIELIINVQFLEADPVDQARQVPCLLENAACPQAMGGVEEDTEA